MSYYYLPKVSSLSYRLSMEKDKKDYKDILLDVIYYITGVLSVFVVFWFIVVFFHLEPLGLFAFLAGIGAALSVDFANIGGEIVLLGFNLNFSILFSLFFYLALGYLLHYLISGFFKKTNLAKVIAVVDALFKFFELFTALRLLFKLSGVTYEAGYFTGFLYDTTAVTSTLLPPLTVPNGVLEFGTLLSLAILVVVDIVTERVIDGLRDNEQSEWEQVVIKVLSIVFAPIRVLFSKFPRPSRIYGKIKLFLAKARGDMQEA